METRAKTPAFAPAAGLLDFTRLGQMARRRWWLPAMGLALGIAAGGYYLARTPKTYSATAVLQVAQGQRPAVNFKDAAQGEDYRAADVVKTFEQVLSSGTLLLRVVRANHLDTDAGFAPPKPGHAPYSESELIERMATKVSVSIRRGTRLLDITVDDHDPQMACRLAGSLVEEYRRQDLEQKLKAAGGTTEFLGKEAERLQNEMTKSENELAQYRADNQAVSLEDNQNIVVAKLRELSDRVTEAKGKRIALEADIARLGKNGSRAPEELLQLTSISSAPAVADLVHQVNVKAAEFEAVKTRYLYKHSKYKEAQGNLEQLKTVRDAEIANAAAGIERSYQAARENEGKLETALQEQEDAAHRLDALAVPYKAVLRRSEADRTLYENVLTRMKEASLGQNLNASDDLREVQSPTVPYRPSKPSRAKTLALGALAGLFLGTTALLLLEMLSHTLQTVDQAEGVLGLPLLAGVPVFKPRRGAGADPVLIAAGDAPQREAFRTLRTTLASFQAQETRSFLFTSAVPGEGKSFCSLNFAATLANQGCHTLLIAADLRRPCDYPGRLQSKAQPGLGECLADALPLAQAVHPTNVPNLFLCPAGGHAGEPAGLLAGERFGRLVREALKVFDRVVIDTPPINAVSDCLLMAPHAEAVCLVARVNATPVNAILRACRTLARAGVVPIGFVLNRLSLRLGSRSAYYYYGREYHQESPPGGASAKTGRRGS